MAGLAAATGLFALPVLGLTSSTAGADPTGITAGPNVTVYATQSLAISNNATAQPGGNLVIAVPAGTDTPGSVTITVGPPAGTNCGATGQTLGFTTTPTVTVGADPDQPTPPLGGLPVNVTAATVTLAPDGTNCTTTNGNVADTATVSWTATNGTTNEISDIVLSNVQYSAGAAAIATAAPTPEFITVALTSTGSGTGAAPPPACTNGTQTTPGTSTFPGACGSDTDAFVNNNLPIVGPPVSNGPTNAWVVSALDPANPSPIGTNNAAPGGFAQTAPLPVVSGQSGGQAVNGWQVQVPDDFGTGDDLVFVVDPPSGYNTDCTTGDGNLGFSGTPKVTVNANGDAPAFSANVTTTSSYNLTNTVGGPPLGTPANGIPDGGCTAAGVNNELVIGSTNAGPVNQPAYPTATRPDQVITISGVSYTATGNVPKGPVTVTVYAVPTVSVGSTEAAPAIDPTAPWGLENAIVFHGVVAGPTTPASVQVAGGQTIGNLTFTETENGDVPAGSTICFQILTPGVFWHTTSTTPTVTTDTSSGAVASSPAIGENPGAGGAPAGSSTVLGFTVTTASTNGPATFTVNATSVDILAGTPSGPITAYAGLWNGAACVPATGHILGTVINAAGLLGNAPIHNVSDALGNGFVSPPQGLIVLGLISAGDNRLAGSDRDATAAEILDTEAPCTNTVSTAGFLANADPVVMAVDNNFPDALSGQYAAANLFTGIVLTGSDAVPGATLAALQTNGIQTVFVIGGSAVIHQDVLSQLAGTQAFVCGGTGPRLNQSGQPITLDVKVLAGATRYDTNLAANTYFPPSRVGGNNLTSNAFNPVYKTAFLATGANFPDALAAGAISTDNFYPVILTDGTTLSQQAANEITDLGIQQILVAGGPAAVGTGVVSAAEALSGVKKVVQLYGADRTATAACIAAFDLATPTAAAGAPNGGLSTATGSFGSACEDPGGATSPVGLGNSEAVQGNGSFWFICQPLIPPGTPCNVGNAAPAVGLARGDQYPDALTAGPFLGFFNDAPLLLTEDPNTLGTYTTTFLQQIGIPPTGMKPITGVLAFGGSAAISDATLAAAQQALSS